MIDQKSLERAADRFRPPARSYERLVVRRERKQRNARIRAGAVAIAVLVLTGVGLSRTFLSEERTADHPTPTPIGPGSAAALAYSRDGDIYVAEWDGTDPVRIADGDPWNDDGSCGTRGHFFFEGGIWSPDGRSLAYRHEDCEAQRDWWDVVISDRRGNLVTSFPSAGWQVAWSPDSTRVAVWVRYEKTVGVYDLNGQRLALLTIPSGWMKAGDNDPVWSQDGSSILVTPNIVLPLDGSTPYRVTPDDPRSFYAEYSPDGSLFAYRGVRRPGARKGLFVASADGSGVRHLVRSLVLDLAWSPTGDRIAFTQKTGEIGLASVTELRVIDVASGTVTRVAGIGGEDVLTPIQFSPEGDRILFTDMSSDGKSSSLWTVAADGSGARQLVADAYWGEWRPFAGGAA